VSPAGASATLVFPLWIASLVPLNHLDDMKLTSVHINFFSPTQSLSEQTGESAFGVADGSHADEDEVDVGLGSPNSPLLNLERTQVSKNVPNNICSPKETTDAEIGVLGWARLVALGKRTLASLALLHSRHEFRYQHQPLQPLRHKVSTYFGQIDFLPIVNTVQFPLECH
jgi:hypothetical protein